MLKAAQSLRSDRPIISLDGEWTYRADPKSIGVKKQWYSGKKLFSNKIQIPGCPQAQGYGVQKNGLRYYSKADGWYRKIFKIPAAWNKQGKIWLHLGGVKPAAEVWINGKKVGASNSSRVPLKADISNFLKPEQENILTVRIFSPDVILDGVWDWEGHYWSGMYRKVFLELTENTWVKGVHIRTDVERKQVYTDVTVNTAQKDINNLKIKCEVTEIDKKSVVGSAEVILSEFSNHSAFCSVPIPVEKSKLWSPEHPNLYRMNIALCDGNKIIDKVSVSFGFREISIKNRKICLNGIPIFLRGGCDDHVYPKTVCPPASKEFYVNRLKLAKKYGFNYTKSCVEVFTDEFLEAADEVGMLVCQEMPFGVSGGYKNPKTGFVSYRTLRQDPPGEFMDLYKKELENIIKFDRNHPSVVIYSMASELPINKSSEKSFRIFSQELPRLAKRLNPNALVIDVTSGYGENTDTKFGRRVTDIIETESIGSREPFRIPRAYFDILKIPLILHEYQWWSCLPKIEQKKLYHNLPTFPAATNEMELAATKNGLSAMLPKFVDNSKELKRILRKEGLEYARRIRCCAGYHHWLIHDIEFCPEGVFNEFWEPPKDLSAEKFRTYNDDTVVLLEDKRKRCFNSGETISLPIFVSHYGRKPINNGTLKWNVKDGQKILFRGILPVKTLSCGELKQLGKIEGKLPDYRQGRKLIISAELLDSKNKFINCNCWQFWIFPEIKVDLSGKKVMTESEIIRKMYPELQILTKGQNIPGDTNLVIATSLEKNILDYLKNGGRVLLFSCGVLPEAKGTNCNLFRTVPFNMKDTGNMGTVINPHPVLDTFPHSGWCSLQFFYFIHGVYPFDLSVFKPVQIKPIIRSIGHYKTMRDKAYMFEAKVGKGCLLATTLNLIPQINTHPEAAFFTNNLISYCLNDKFQSINTISPKLLEANLNSVK